MDLMKICDKDCEHCKYDDCINDDEDALDIARAEARDVRFAQKENTARYRYNHSLKRKEAQARYCASEKGKEARHRASVKYMEKHREQNRLKSAEYYAKNREKELARNKEYRRKKKIEQQKIGDAI